MMVASVNMNMSMLRGYVINISNGVAVCSIYADEEGDCCTAVFRSTKKNREVTATLRGDELQLLVTKKSSDVITKHTLAVQDGKREMTWRLEDIRFLSDDVAEILSKMIADTNLEKEQELTQDLKGNISIISNHHVKIAELMQTKRVKLTYDELIRVHTLVMKPGVACRVSNAILDIHEQDLVLVWCPVINSSQPSDLTDVHETTVRRCCEVPCNLLPRLYVFGDENLEGGGTLCIQGLEYDEDNEPCWHTLRSSCRLRRRVAVANFQDNIYCVGSDYGKVDKYDPIHETWHQMAGTNMSRTGAGLVAVDDRLYVLGGEYADNASNSMESYDPQSNSWEIIPAKMAFHRTFLGAAVLHGRVYAVGGGTNAVECFDPTTQVWSMVKPMRKVRTGPGVVAHEGFIYCVGGACSDKKIASRTVERYDPETDQWVWISSMFRKRKNHAIAVMNRYIYAIGGIGEDGKWLASVERLDPMNNYWEEVIDMPIAFCGPSAAVV